MTNRPNVNISGPIDLLIVLSHYLNNSKSPISHARKNI